MQHGSGHDLVSLAYNSGGQETGGRPDLKKKERGET